VSSGLSVFFQVDDDVLHTYSAYARGAESLTDTYRLLDTMLALKLLSSRRREPVVFRTAVKLGSFPLRSDPLLRIALAIPQP